ncbi:7653_t:CDS:1, partial [Funneliformis caledonium]
GITMKISIAFMKTAKVVIQGIEDQYKSNEYKDEYLEKYLIYLFDDVESEESELDDKLGFNSLTDYYYSI